jgi:glutamyl-tRNA reductase
MHVGHLVVANRTLARAVTVAKPFGATAVGLESLAGEISLADAIVCAAAADEWLVRREDLRAPSTRTAPLFVVDLAMPAGVEGGDVDGVVRMDLEGLQSLVDEHRRQREAEIPRVGAVDGAALDRLSRRLLDQILAIPLTQLEDPALPIDPAQAEYLRRLFSLEAS